MPERRRSGVLLAGGQNTRFGGEPKGLRPFGDARLADRPLRALMDACDEALVAANDPEARRWFPFQRIVCDETPGLGALGALRTALHHSRHDVVVVCAWDMPFVTPELLSALAAVVEDGAPCCVPVHANGRSEPLCAAYRRSVCLPATVQLLVLFEEFAAHALREQVGGAAWRIEDHLQADDATRIFSNVNTADDLVHAARWLTDHPTPDSP